MRCENCHGEGMVRVMKAIEHRRYPFTDNDVEMVHIDGKEPCPECGGTGIMHCCDGLTACNDA